jgi:hypothetical protein
LATEQNVTEEITDQQFYDGAEDLERSGTPLRRFWGLVEEVEPRSANNRRSVEVNSKDIKIVDYPANHPKYPGAKGSVIPYDFPSASFTVNYNLSRSGRPSERGAWGLFVTSVGEVGISRARDLVGHRVLFEGDADHEYAAARAADPDRNVEAQERIAGMVWRVVEIDGVTAATGAVTDLDAHFTGLLGEGMTQPDFSQAALKDPTGRQNQQGIINGSILSNLVASGKVTLEGDLYKPA